MSKQQSCIVCATTKKAKQKSTTIIRQLKGQCNKKTSEAFECRRRKAQNATPSYLKSESKHISVTHKLYKHTYIQTHKHACVAATAAQSLSSTIARGIVVAWRQHIATRTHKHTQLSVAFVRLGDRSIGWVGFARVINSFTSDNGSRDCALTLFNVV